MPIEFTNPKNKEIVTDFNPKAILEYERQQAEKAARNDVITDED